MIGALVLPGIRIRPARGVEAFPASLVAATLADQLDRATLIRLKAIEKELGRRAPLEPVLKARSGKDLLGAIETYFDVAADYYAESSIAIWRGLDHDYQKLLNLSINSAHTIEREFLDHPEKLKPATFVNAVAGIRVVSKVGEWIIRSEQHKEATEGELPVLEYLLSFMAATSFTSCLLSHVRGTVSDARPSNLAVLSKLLMQVAEDTYQVAIRDDLPRLAEEENSWYWSPRSQEGEVEADLDRQLGHVRRFDSAERLIRSLKG